MPTTVITGLVLDSDGIPVSGARVLITESPVAATDIAALTGPDGRFAVSAPMPGRYELTVYGDDGTVVKGSVDVPGDDAGGGAIEIRLQLVEAL